MNTSIINYEDPESKQLIPFLYDADNGKVWGTQKQIAQTLKLDVRTVSHHIQNYKKQRGDKANQGIRKFAIPTAGGIQNVEHYDMTVVAYVGFRAQATERVIAFQDWVGEILNRHITTPDLGSQIANAIREIVGPLVQGLQEAKIDHANLEKRVEKLEREPKALKSGRESPKGKLMSVKAFGQTRGIYISFEDAQQIGKLAVKESDRRNWPIGETREFFPDGTMRAVNTYYQGVLVAIFDKIEKGK